MAGELLGTFHEWSQFLTVGSTLGARTRQFGMVDAAVQEHRIAEHSGASRSIAEHSGA